MDTKKNQKYSYQNQKSIQKSSKCGCYYCLRIFSPQEITEWNQEKTKLKTAMCPYCGIDSVLGDVNVDININLLKEMNEYWFAVRELKKS